MCKSVSSSSVHGTDMSLHRRLDEQTVLVTAVIVVVNHGLQIIRIFLYRLEKIKEILQSDLDDPDEIFYLNFSFRLLEQEEEEIPV